MSHYNVLVTWDVFSPFKRNFATLLNLLKLIFLSDKILPT